jgi:hypothetical protein
MAQPMDQDTGDSTTVTVFGFPPQAASIILSRFREFGQVDSYALPSAGANWMTITYRTRWQAQRALGKNATLVGGDGSLGGWMVGVTLGPSEQAALGAQAEQDGDVFHTTVARDTERVTVRQDGLWNRTMEAFFGW